VLYLLNNNIIEVSDNTANIEVKMFQFTLNTVYGRCQT